MAYSGIAVIIGIILAIVATVLLYVLIMPEKKKGRLNGFFKVVRSIFNFDALLLEKIMKILYAFSTLACIIIGFLMLFSFQTYNYYGYSYYGTTRTTWYGWIGLLIMILGPIIFRIIYEYSLLLVFATSRLMSIDKKIPDQGQAENASASAPTPTPAPAPAPTPTPAPAPAPTPTPAPSMTPAPATAQTPAEAPIYGTASAYETPNYNAAPIQETAAQIQEPVYRFCTKCGTKYDITKGGCPNCGR